VVRNLYFLFLFCLNSNKKNSIQVGKTSLITRFMYDSFDNTYQVIFSSKLIFFSKFHFTIL
jgi:hypothetical protein